MRTIAARLLAVALGVGAAAGCGGGSSPPKPAVGQGSGATAASRQSSDTQGQKADSKTEPPASRTTAPSTPEDKAAPKGDGKTDDKAAPKTDDKAAPKTDAKTDPKADPKGDGKGGQKVEAKNQIKGLVKYNGKALDGGQILFRNAAGDTVAADLKADGTYAITDPPPGTLRVAISYVDPKVTEYYRALSQASRGDKPLPPGDPAQFNKIPAKYSDVGASPLTAEYKGGIATCDFELKD